MEKLPAEIESAILSFAEGEQKALDEHPEIDALVAYHEGRLDDESRETLREHLTLCGECSALLLDLADFHGLEPVSEEHRLSEADEGALKDVLKKRLRVMPVPKPSAEVVSLESRRPAVSRRTPWKLLAQAAVLFLALGGFWSLVDRPGADVDILSLRPESTRGSVAEVFQVPEWTKSYLLVLGSVRLDEADRFRLVILGAAGDPVVSGTDLRKGRDGTLNFRVPRRQLAFGIYEIQLFMDASDEPFETYRLEIEASE